MNPPFTQSLIELIEKFVAELVQMQFDQRKALPQNVSTHYLQFEHDYMNNYSTESEYVTHVTIRHLLRWVYENQAAASDPSTAIGAIKYIAPAIVDEDPTTVSAVVQALIVSGEGVKPTVNANVNLLPHQAGFNLSSNIVKGQLAYNDTDDIWYIRVGNSIFDLRDALDFQISHIDGLQAALDQAALGGYTFNDPLEADAEGNVDLKIDPATLEIDGSGRLAVKNGAGVLLSTIIPQSFNNDNLINNMLIIEHGKNTNNVKLYLRDDSGMDVIMPYDTSNPNQVVIDFGSPIGGNWKYILEYWTSQNAGVYPDPVYSLATHNHNGIYAPILHSHSEYAPIVHNHDDRYPLKSHTHNYAATDHNHNTWYEPIITKNVFTIDSTARNAALSNVVFYGYRFGNLYIGRLSVRTSLAFHETGGGAIVGKINYLGNVISPTNNVEFPGALKKVSFYESAWGLINPTGSVYLFMGKANEDYIFNFSFSIS